MYRLTGTYVHLVFLVRYGHDFIDGEVILFFFGFVQGTYVVENLTAVPGVQQDYLLHFVALRKYRQKWARKGTCLIQARTQ